MTVQKKIKTKQKLLDIINYVVNFHFNTYIEKPKIKRLNNIDSFSELHFYEELIVVKTDKALRRYAMTYKV